MRSPQEAMGMSQRPKVQSPLGDMFANVDWDSLWAALAKMGARRPGGEESGVMSPQAAFSSAVPPRKEYNDVDWSSRPRTPLEVAFGRPGGDGGEMMRMPEEPPARDPVYDLYEPMERNTDVPNEYGSAMRDPGYGAYESAPEPEMPRHMPEPPPEARRAAPPPPAPRQSAPPAPTARAEAPAAKAPPQAQPFENSADLEKQLAHVKQIALFNPYEAAQILTVRFGVPPEKAKENIRAWVTQTYGK